MESWQKKYIKEQLPDLIDLTRCSNYLLVLLRAKHILNDDDLDLLETVGKSSGHRTQVSKMYDLLLTREDSYDTLIKKLYETNQSGAGKILLKGYEIDKMPDTLSRLKGNLSD